MPTLADADPVAEALAWLQGRSDVTTAFGGVDHLSGVNEPPYPHLRIAGSPGGDDGDLLWVASPEVLVETYGDPDGSPGWAELRRLHYTALVALRALPERTHSPTMTVVTAVTPSSSAAPLPLQLGQPRWVSTCRLTLHPAIA